ncbi:MAG: SLBB domain-containing protein, partial [Bacteroidales bacterium]|nr:SLBB domain-containing protein [Bacteroidales bacterium]
PLADLIEEDEQKHNYTLQHRDSLIIYSAGVVHKKERVTIHGEVEEPGSYVLEEDMDIHDLLLQAGGFTKIAYKYNVEVFRIGNQENENQITTAYSINISPDILNNLDSEQQIKLKDFDMVVVRKDPDFSYHKVVNIEGEVKFPGRYPILRESETLSELVRRAGGLTSEAFLPGLQYTRNDTNRVVGDFDRVLESGQEGITLQQGDSIFVPQHPGTVKVSGAVRNPGVVQYQPEWGLERYVEAAGDYTFDAAKSKTIVYYPGGNARRKHWYRKPDVKEGSEVFVPLKPEREPLDVTQLLTEWASIATSVATVIYIINRN